MLACHNTGMMKESQWCKQAPPLSTKPQNCPYHPITMGIGPTPSQSQSHSTLLKWQVSQQCLEGLPELLDHHMFYPCPAYSKWQVSQQCPNVLPSHHALHSHQFPMSMAGALSPHIMPWVGSVIGKCGVILGIGDSSAGSRKDRDGETHSSPFDHVTLCPHFHIMSTVHVQCNYKQFLN
jgi:hypothetical protein